MRGECDVKSVLVSSATKNTAAQLNMKVSSATKNSVGQLSMKVMLTISTNVHVWSAKL